MPRTGRGGARTGTPGQQYTNRTDLNTQLPVSTAPSQQYGDAAAQARAQAAVPMASGPPTPTPGPITAAAPIAPGGLPPLDAPTERPGEPVTHGAETGPGGGPEVMGGFQRSKISQTISQLAQQSGNADLMVLAQRAQAQGQ